MCRAESEGDDDHECAVDLEGPRADLDILKKKVIPWSHDHLALPGIKSRFLACPVRKLVTIPTELSPLQY